MDSHRRNVDYLSAALRHHVRKHHLEGVKHALQVDLLHFVPLGFGHSEKSLAGIDACVIDQHIDAAEAADRALHPGPDVGGAPPPSPENLRRNAPPTPSFLCTTHTPP